MTALLLSSIFSTVASADSFNGGRKGNGMHYAYYSPSVYEKGYSTYFHDARTYWNQSPKIGIGQSNTYKKWDDRYYANFAQNTDILGQIYIAKYINNVAQYGQDAWINHYWDFTHVILYYNSIQKSSANTRSKVSYIAAHEVGHSIKMAHTTKSNSVLRTPYQGYLIPGGSGNITISASDKASVNAKW